jgi:hypothetical protein
MSPAHAEDSIDALLKRAPAWEPPPGFSLHVAAEARGAAACAAADTAFARRQRSWLAGWSRGAIVAGVAGRMQSAMWVARQYVSLWRWQHGRRSP